MALKITTDTPHGLKINGAYHQITMMRLLAPDDLLIQLNVYVTEADRRANKQPIDQRTVFLIGSQVATTGTLLGSLYDAIKTTPEYVGSEDA